ncbi:MAG: Hsp70 family protein [Pseudomonadota bacterium]
MSERVLGIDLGTTYSACGVWEDGHARLIENAYGDTLTPSVVGVDGDGTLLVGKPAKERLVSHPESTVAFFKRAMGTEHEIDLGKRRRFTSVELSAMVLRSLKEDAERALGQEIKHAVVSVPAYFNEAQRQATRDAGQIAGLSVNRLINEPTAAAIAHGLAVGAEQRFIVLDLGGGTFDVSILEFFDGVLEVHASAGDSALGGEDFNAAILKHFLEAHDIDPADLAPTEQQVLYARVETAKRKMRRDRSPEIELRRGDTEYRTTLDDEFIKAAAAPLLVRLRAPIERALSDAATAPSDIDEVILVGGSTRLAVFRSLVTSLFRKIPRADTDPDLTVARGAVLQAGLAARDEALEDVVLTDVCPFSLGVGVQSPDWPRVRELMFSPILERNCTVPASRLEQFWTVEDNQDKIDLGVYQGESRWVSKNLFLGSLTVPVPKAPAGQESVSVRFSYDVNGLLEVDVKADTTGVQRSKTIENRAGSLSQLEKDKSAKRLAGLKVLPWERAEIRALTARADRIYGSLLGARREYLGQAMSRFQAILERQDPKQIERESKAFSELLDSLDVDIWS